MANEMMMLILQHKLAFLNSIIDPLMIWYVSSVVFCASIISAVYINRKDIASIHGLNWFCSLILFFFSSIVTFGIWAIVSLVVRIIDIVSISAMPHHPYRTERDRTLFQDHTTAPHLPNRAW